MYTYLKNILTTMLIFSAFLFGNSLTLADNGDGTWAVGYGPATVAGRLS